MHVKCLACVWCENRLVNIGPRALPEGCLLGKTAQFEGS